MIRGGMAAATGIAALTILATVVISNRDGSTVEDVDPLDEAKSKAEAIPDASISYDGTRLTSSLPKEWRAGRSLTLEIDNPTDEVLHFILGSYQKGSGRTDLLKYAKKSPLKLMDSSPPFLKFPPSYHEHVFKGRNAGGGREPIFELKLSAGRYYVVTFDSPEAQTSTTDADPSYVLEVWPDLIVRE